MQKLPIYDSKSSERILFHANTGYGMTAKWWRDTFNLYENGLLWGIYMTATGKLRRTIR